MAKRYDVIVVGAGPAGAACAKRCVAAGLRTLIVEKKRLPRHKNCSGLITHDALASVESLFGPIPSEALSRSGAYRGVGLHFDRAPSLYVDAETPVPNVWRNTFDAFLVEASGAEVLDGVAVASVREEGQGVLVEGKRAGRRRVLRAAHVVGADGGPSGVVRTLAPEIHRSVPWAVAYQCFYRGSVDLEPGYFHTFFCPGMGVYTWLTFKDAFLLIGTAVLRGHKLKPYYPRLLAMLRKRFGLRIPERPEMIHGCLGNGMAPLHRFFLGRGRILVAGEAAGFLHMGGEGISAALATGAAAGESVVRATWEPGRRNPLEAYRTAVRGEMERTKDQWNLLRMFGSSTFRVKGGPALRQRPLAHPRRVRDVWRFVNQEARGTGMGAAILKHTLLRQVLGRYGSEEPSSTGRQVPGPS